MPINIDLVKNFPRSLSITQLGQTLSGSRHAHPHFACTNYLMDILNVSAEKNNKPLQVFVVMYQRSLDDAANKPKQNDS